MNLVLLRLRVPVRAPSHRSSSPSLASLTFPRATCCVLPSRVAPSLVFRLKYMDAGELVPDQLVIDLVKERLAADDAQQGFILDGFRATPPGCDARFRALRHGSRDRLRPSGRRGPEVIIARLSSRRTCRACGYTGTAADATCPKCAGEMYQRDDDKPETIKNRLDVYEKSTSPLVDYYRGQGLLKSVNGDQARETVYGDVKEALGL